MNKLPLWTIMTILVLSMIFSCQQKPKKENFEKVIVLKAENGKSVFELTRQSHQTQYIKSAMGILITAIDGIENGNVGNWFYYINGKPGMVSCDKAIASASDKIEWRYK